MTSAIYVVEAVDGSLKAGRSARLHVRLAQLEFAHGPVKPLFIAAAPPSALVELEEYAHSALRWWRRRGEWYEPTRWARQLVSEWAAEGEMFCPAWLHWLDLDTREPLRDWRFRPFVEPLRPLAALGLPIRRLGAA